MTSKPAPAATRQPTEDRAPDTPTDVGGRGWWNTAKRAFAEFRDDDMMMWAAGLTYYAVLAIFPALIALIALIGVFGQHPQTTNAILDIIRSIAPADIVGVVEETITNVVQNKGGAGALLGAGLLAALWTASAYIGAFFKASNAIYEVDEGRSFFKLRPLQIAMTLFFLLVVAFGMIVFIASGGIAQAIGNTIGLGDTAVTIWQYAKWPVLLVVVAALMALLYYAAPNVKQPKFRWMTPGGLIGIVVLVLASVAFSFYVANFGSYNATYGALAAVPIALTWLWISNMALLFGAEFDAELERQRRIDGGMRPVDAEPFLPYRSEPDESKDGAVMARKQFREAHEGQDGGDREARTERTDESAGHADRDGGEWRAAGEAGRPAGARSAGEGRFTSDDEGGQRTGKRRSGGLLSKLRGR